MVRECQRSSRRLVSLSSRQANEASADSNSIAARAETGTNEANNFSKLDSTHLRELGDLQNNYLQATEHVKNCLGLIADAAVDSEEYMSDANLRTKIVGQLENHMQRMIDKNITLMIQVKVLEQLNRQAVVESIDLDAKFTLESENAMNNIFAQGPLKRYGENPDYLDFKRRVWDVKHENEPLPSLRTWFANPVEGEAQDEVQNSDDEVIMEKEQASLRCPITLDILQVPVSPLGCPHVFTEAAIIDMIMSAEHRQKKSKHNVEGIECPVTGCSNRILRQNLRPNKLVQRRLQIYHQKQRRSLKAFAL